MSKVVLSHFFHFLEHHRTDFLRGIQSAVNINADSIVVAFGNIIAPMLDLFGNLIKPPTHKPLHRSDGIDGIGDGLTLGRISHFAFSILQKCNYTRGGSSTFVIGDHNGFIAFHYGDTAVGRSKVNSNDFCHILDFRYLNKAIDMPAGKSGNLVSIARKWVTKRTLNL